MNEGRADFAVHLHNGQIFVFGGMAFKPDEKKKSKLVESLNTCEVYSIADDKWTSIAPL